MLDRNDKISSDISAYIASTVKQKETKGMLALDFTQGETSDDLKKLHIEDASDIGSKVTKNRRYPHDVVSTVETVGNWYIKNVPTYMKKTQSKTTQLQRTNASLNREWGDIKLYNYYDLWFMTQNYITNGVNNMKIDYRNAYNKELQSDKDHLTQYLYAAGDECVRFGMAVYNYVTEGKLLDLHNMILNKKSGNAKKSDYFNYGNTLLNRNADTFVNSAYEIDEWFDSIGYYRIDVDKNFQLEDLKPGDFLCCSGGNEHGHVEFYLGHEFDKEEETNADGVTIDTYKIGKRIEIEPTTDYSGGKAEGTFGWGEVSDRLPSYSTKIDEKGKTHEYKWYFYKSADGTSIYRCKGFHKIIGKKENKYTFKELLEKTAPNGKKFNYTFDGENCCDPRKYNVIYRKKGY